MNNCRIITSSKCDLNVVSGQMREKVSNRRHVVVVAELLITAGPRNRFVRFSENWLIAKRRRLSLFIERLKTIRHLIHHLRCCVVALLHTKVADVGVVVDSIIHGIWRREENRLAFERMRGHSSWRTCRSSVGCVELHIRWSLWRGVCRRDEKIKVSFEFIRKFSAWDSVPPI